MKQKIDTALDYVKEPESGLSIAQLGLGKSCDTAWEIKLYVFTTFIKPNHNCCCTVLQ